MKCKRAKCTNEARGDTMSGEFGPNYCSDECFLEQLYDALKAFAPNEWRELSAGLAADGDFVAAEIAGR